MMKLLFLDIDGVLTNNKLVYNNSNSDLIYPFSKSCVEALNIILKSHRLKIILTSSWRNVFDVDKQCRIFKENNLRQMPAGTTKDLGYENRYQEIALYLENKKVDTFVILDDMEIKGFENNFVWINPAYGLTTNHIAVINKILNQTNN